MNNRFLLLLASLPLCPLLWAQTSTTPVLCQWNNAADAGTLHPDIGEASGMAVSARYPNRLYHHNDSGDSGRFLITDEKGANAQSVAIEGFTPSDVEDLAIGPCPGAEGDCLFLADIGDNARRRADLVVVVVKEQATFPASVPAFQRLRIRYPDGAQDAESLAVHPDGTIYILTKVYSGSPTGAQTAGPDQLFKLTKDRQKVALREPATLELVATLDFEKWLPNSSAAARIPTGMDISRDGKRVLIVLYADAFELALDLSKPVPSPDSWREGKEFQRIKLVNLPQQESIAYSPDGKSFFYATERGFGRGASPARLMRVSCRP